MSLMRIGPRLESARSEKQSKTEFDTRLLLGWYDAEGHDVQVSFSIGENGPRWRTRVTSADAPPETLDDSSVPLGRLFSFCEPFGAPQIELFGLIIPREQVTGVR